MIQSKIDQYMRLLPGLHASFVVDSSSDDDAPLVPPRKQPSAAAAHVVELQRSRDGSAIIPQHNGREADSFCGESKVAEVQPDVADLDDEDRCNISTDESESSNADNPLSYAGQHGVFPNALPSPLQDRPEHEFLADAGYLWNAVPPRSSRYMDLEAVHEGSTTSGSSGSSEGSLSDDFVVKDGPVVKKRQLKLLQQVFPKTFKRTGSK